MKLIDKDVLIQQIYDMHIDCKEGNPKVASYDMCNKIIETINKQKIMNKEVKK